MHHDLEAARSPGPGDFRWPNAEQCILPVGLGKLRNFDKDSVKSLNFSVNSKFKSLTLVATSTFSPGDHKIIP